MLIDLAAGIHAFEGLPKLITINIADKKTFLKEVLDVTKYHDDLRHLLLGSVIFGIDVEFCELEGLRWVIE